MTTFKVAVLPEDYIGPEVVAPRLFREVRLKPDPPEESPRHDLRPDVVPGQHGDIVDAQVDLLVSGSGFSLTHVCDQVGFVTATCR